MTSYSRLVIKAASWFFKSCIFLVTISFRRRSDLAWLYILSLPPPPIAPTIQPQIKYVYIPREHSVHHIVPQSRTPDNLKQILGCGLYLSILRATTHSLLHKMFRNRIPKEIVLMLLRHYKINRDIDDAVKRRFFAFMDRIFKVKRAQRDKLGFSKKELVFFCQFADGQTPANVLNWLILEVWHMNAFEMSESEKKAFHEFCRSYYRASLKIGVVRYDPDVYNRLKKKTKK